jgi:hypothetical protein
MTTVTVAVPRVFDSPGVGGHFWEYMQYVRSFMDVGCEVWWLERANGEQRRFERHETDREQRLATFMDDLRAFGLGNRVVLYCAKGSDPAGGDGIAWEPLNMRREQSLEVVHRTDLLVNFDYHMRAEFVARFRRSALIDIDPGLLQSWMHSGQVSVAAHDAYFTTGETVGTPAARFPDCGLSWIRIRPGVALELWPVRYDEDASPFTTVSSWFGGGHWHGEWMIDENGTLYDNNKRVTFLEFERLPARVDAELELALALGDGLGAEELEQVRREAVPGLTDYRGDEDDRRRLERHGWRVRRASDVAATPESYRSYIQGSRGEFSCVKPSCIRLANAWISNRTLCYLASGKPAIVQDTGPSAYLPSGEGLFRFSTIAEAEAAFRDVNEDYTRHARAARELAESFFDARAAANAILDGALA